MTKSKRSARLVSVPNCGQCPFSFSPDDGGDWTCTAIEDADGHFRVIKKLQARRGGPWLPPPRWCPLRTEIVVVVLEDVR